MSQYIKKHRRHFAGIALPLFFLFVLGAVGLSVFPGWLNESYSRPGEACDTLDPGETTCNKCNQEFCNTNGVCQDGVGNTTLTDPDNASPFLCPGVNPPQPGCWDTCFETINVDGTEIAACGPNDAFCSDISGGNQPNDCRTGDCTPISTPDPANPSGCDYQLVPDTTNDECVLCSDPGTGIPPACGNGICEGAEGEDCVTCPIDCLLPGFDDTCPLTSGGIIDDACLSGQITFDGPPYNNFGTGECEDGDLCTDNACVGSGPGSTCDATPKSCSGDVADFCCPSGCEPPPDGPGSCPDLLGTPCDVDCYVPQECVPTPSPTPTPPVTGLCLTGSSLIAGEGNPAPACDCSLNPNAPMAPGKTGAMGLMGIVLAAFVISLRKKARS